MQGNYVWSNLGLLMNLKFRYLEIVKVLLEASVEQNMFKWAVVSFTSPNWISEYGQDMNTTVSHFFVVSFLDANIHWFQYDIRVKVLHKWTVQCHKRCSQNQWE